jgi:hypothetical protein
MRYEKDVDGKWHYIEYQEQGNSCGPACVKIVARMVNHQDLGEDYCRAQIAASEGHVGASLGTTGVLIESRSFANVGTWSVGEGLGNLRPSICYDKFSTLVDPSSVLSQTSTRRPAIAEVRWLRGGAHWVVVAGSLSASRYLVIDPYFGIQYVRVSGSTFQNYEVRHTTTRIVLAQATWGSHVILTK